MKTPGKPKSGKTWKVNSRPARDLNKVLNTLSSTPSFAHKIQQKTQTQLAKDYENQLQSAQSKRKRDARLQAEAKKKRKEENALANGQFQLLKNTRKMQHWSKKARRDLMKLPASQYYKVIKAKE